MPKFKFRLEPILTIKKDERDSARHSVSEANKAIELLGEQITQKEIEIRELKALSETQLEGMLSVDSLLSYSRYELQLAADVNQLNTQIEQINVELQNRQEKLWSKEAEVKQYERLRELAYNEHLKCDEKRMQNEMDEYASTRYMPADEQGE